MEAAVSEQQVNAVVYELTRKPADEDTIRWAIRALQGALDHDLPEHLTEWVRQTFEDDELRDMLEYGMDAGWSQLIYYNDIDRLYQHYEDEVWERTSDSREMGLITVTEGTPIDFETKLVWEAVYQIAQDLVNA